MCVVFSTLESLCYGIFYNGIQKYHNQFIKAFMK